LPSSAKSRSDYNTVIRREGGRGGPSCVHEFRAVWVESRFFKRSFTAGRRLKLPAVSFAGSKLFYHRHRSDGSTFVNSNPRHSPLKTRRVISTIKGQHRRRCLQRLRYPRNMLPMTLAFFFLPLITDSSSHALCWPPA
jgi:hypothetical protein